MRLLKTPAAEQDLFAIWDYIARDSPNAADRFLQRIQRPDGILIYRVLHGARSWEDLINE
jgi:plasmid stabilization system protein ParE